MSICYYIGVDPGASGSIVCINERGVPLLLMPLKNMTDTDIKENLELLMQLSLPLNGVLERVHSMPKQGVSSTFKFGSSFGALGAHLVWAGVRFELVTPHKWQGDLSCRSRGDKNVTKRKAQQLFPNTKITHAIADGLLLAEWGRRFGAWGEDDRNRLANTG
jgi:crossover junction endodeoxyribonuclease RuvC